MVGQRAEDKGSAGGGGGASIAVDVHCRLLCMIIVSKFHIPSNLDWDLISSMMIMEGQSGGVRVN